MFGLCKITEMRVFQSQQNKESNVKHTRLETWNRIYKIHLVAFLKINIFAVNTKQEGAELFCIACPGLTTEALGQPNLS